MILRNVALKSKIKTNSLWVLVLMWSLKFRCLRFERVHFKRDSKRIAWIFNIIINLCRSYRNEENQTILNKHEHFMFFWSGLSRRHNLWRTLSNIETINLSLQTPLLFLSFNITWIKKIGRNFQNMGISLNSVLKDRWTQLDS